MKRTSNLRPIYLMLILTDDIFLAWRDTLRGCKKNLSIYLSIFATWMNKHKTVASNILAYLRDLKQIQNDDQAHRQKINQLRNINVKSI